MIDKSIEYIEPGFLKICFNINQNGLKLNDVDNFGVPSF